MNAPTPEPVSRRPRLGFLGVGWIGRNRLEAVGRSGVAEIAAVADPLAPTPLTPSGVEGGARILDSLADLLQLDLDGIVIATPSALHAEQAIAALRRGVAVFCQKPLGRDAAEARAVVRAAREMNLLLGVDLSYRFLRGMKEMRELIAAGELGEVFAAQLAFHNAYGPDKPWFYDRRQSGGGCVMDLGIHLVDLALWMLAPARVERVTGRVFAAGKPLGGRNEVEDYGTALLELSSGATVQLACSWKLHAGCDAAVEASFFGTRGGISLRNVNGSFYDFTLDRFRGTARVRISEPPDAWGGRAAVDWATRLAAGARFDPEVERLVEVAQVLDRIYAACES